MLKILYAPSPDAKCIKLPDTWQLFMHVGNKCSLTSTCKPTKILNWRTTEHFNAHIKEICISLTLKWVQIKPWCLQNQLILYTSLSISYLQFAVHHINLSNNKSHLPSQITFRIYAYQPNLQLFKSYGANINFSKHNSS